MKQISFSAAEFSGKKRVTRRERFLNEIERVVPWQKLMDVIAPYYTKGGKTGRPPIPLERLLRMYLVQQCFALSDEDTEDALYDSQAIRDFVGLDLAREKAPDATTLLHFRHLLEKHPHRRPLRRDQCASGRERSDPPGRNDRRCHTDRRPLLDQEQGREARP